MSEQVKQTTDFRSALVPPGAVRVVAVVPAGPGFLRVWFDEGTGALIAIDPVVSKFLRQARRDSSSGLDWLPKFWTAGGEAAGGSPLPAAPGESGPAGPRLQSGPPAGAAGPAQ